MEGDNNSAARTHYFVNIQSNNEDTQMNIINNIINEIKNGNYKSALGYLTIPWISLYEICILLIFKYSDILIKECERYYKISLFVCVICLICNLVIKFHPNMSQIYYFIFIIASVIRVLALCTSLFHENFELYQIFSPNDFLKIYVVKIILLFSILCWLIVLSNKKINTNEITILLFVTFIIHCCIQLGLSYPTIIPILFDNIYLILSLAVSLFSYKKSINSNNSEYKDLNILHFFHMLSFIIISTLYYHFYFIFDEKYITNQNNK
ncbi:hypothetical protein H311_03027 [Anncaliia algerae PRA109]|nr:hypothetical protein H311_03027 [Anncaliia algerae PRA109]